MRLKLHAQITCSNYLLKLLGQELLTTWSTRMQWALHQTKIESWHNMKIRQNKVTHMRSTGDCQYVNIVAHLTSFRQTHMKMWNVSEERSTREWSYYKWKMNVNNNQNKRKARKQDLKMKNNRPQTQLHWNSKIKAVGNGNIRRISWKWIFQFPIIHQTGNSPNWHRKT